MNYLMLIISIIFLLIIIFIIYYNMMIKRENDVKNAYSLLDIMFKRRNDLIPNLVSCVKGYINYEEKVLKKLVYARNNFDKNAFKYNNIINDNLNNIFLISEGYPKLKANEEFINLQKSLYDMEEIISAGRRTYNAHVTSYNNFISYFPNFIFAKILHFKKYDLFKIDEEERKGKVYYENK